MAAPRGAVLRDLTPVELVGEATQPSTVNAWKELAGSLLTPEACTFHRNVEISALYAWLYRRLPQCFKWAGMAALASHHIRLALAPLRLEGDRHGHLDGTRTWTRRQLLLADTDVIRQTNNGIYDDIFWVHLAYLSSRYDIEYIRALLDPLPEYAPLLRGFDKIDSGRSKLGDGSAPTHEQGRLEVWDGNVELLEHEQRSLVQPHFDRLSCGYARMISMGSATSFEARSLRDRAALFTSFYVSALASPGSVTDRLLPRITSFDERWRWLNVRVVPRFQRFEGRPVLAGSVFDKIFDQYEYFAAHPCALVSSSAHPSQHP